VSCLLKSLANGGWTRADTVCGSGQCCRGGERRVNGSFGRRRGTAKVRMS
jgi:hypothetical protein